eukprot:TRINITY_DN51185_c0_g1_i1.p1 TRINITY_DN51185_c0_g1~~TRINITY_DN51185_c0_g1_i1.p1  ORF type:complete len:287 (-),score=52.85 TRINITY_DN51185_c0_g1_i1:67-927(-)
MGQQESQGFPEAAGRTSGSSADACLPKVAEILQLLRKLEDDLANPMSASAVGDTYRQLVRWYKAHQFDRDLQKILLMLSSEDMYPTWRRQALEEAYRLFYDEVANRGLEEAISQLPEPPTSEEIGFRQLPEALVSRSAADRSAYKGCFEDHNACLVYRRRWDYEVRRTSDEGFIACGRSIFYAGQARYFCAGNAMTKVAQVVLPVEQCCAKREDSRSAKGPFFLPQGRASTVLRPQDEVLAEEACRAAHPVEEPLQWDDGRKVKQRARLVTFPAPRDLSGSSGSYR